MSLLDFDNEFGIAPEKTKRSKWITPQTMIKGPFTYMGSKKASLPFILPHLPESGVYCEVFGGSGVVLLNRKPCKLDVFNDAYSAVTDFYKVIRNPETFTKLVERLQYVLVSREDFTTARAEWATTTDPVERAALWYTMVQLSFLGKGKAFGRSTTTDATNKVDSALPRFLEIHERMKKVQIENLDWEKCILDYDSYKTVFYLDPPYLRGDQNIYPSTIDHTHLLDVIFRLKGFVALSGYSTELYESKPWSHIETWDVADRGSHTAERGTVVEKLYIKNAS